MTRRPHMLHIVKAVAQPDSLHNVAVTCTGSWPNLKRQTDNIAQHAACDYGLRKDTRAGGGLATRWPVVLVHQHVVEGLPPAFWQAVHAHVLQGGSGTGVPTARANLRQIVMSAT